MSRRNFIKTLAAGAVAGVNITGCGETPVTKMDEKDLDAMRPEYIGETIWKEMSEEEKRNIVGSEQIYTQEQERREDEEEEGGSITRWAQRKLLEEAGDALPEAALPSIALLFGEAVRLGLLVGRIGRGEFQRDAHSQIIASPPTTQAHVTSTLEDLQAQLKGRRASADLGFITTAWIVYAMEACNAVYRNIGDPDIGRLTGSALGHIMSALYIITATRWARNRANSDRVESDIFGITQRALSAVRNDMRAIETRNNTENRERSSENSGGSSSRIIMP